MPSPVIHSIFTSNMLYMIQFDHPITRFLLSISTSCHIFAERGKRYTGIPYIYLWKPDVLCNQLLLFLTKKSYRQKYQYVCDNTVD